MKQAYEKQISALEGRIAKLERENQAKKASLPEAVSASSSSNKISLTDLAAEAHVSLGAAENSGQTPDTSAKLQAEQQELANTPRYDDEYTGNDVSFSSRLEISRSFSRTRQLAA